MMLYPELLTPQHNKIGITAPSCGIIHKLDEYEKSIEKFKEQGYEIVETDNVRTDGDVSSSSKERADQLMDLVKDKSVNFIMCATGGDFLTDMLPYVDFDFLKNNPKWMMGASDPTNLLYINTTRNDIASLCGHNAGSFGASILHESQKNVFEFIKGNIVDQHSYDLYEDKNNDRIDDNYNLTEKVRWYSNKDKVDITGRIIGGCIDCLRYLPGTKYDFTQKFVEKYKNDGIIFYFDIFSMSSEDFYLTLFQLREAGWFKYLKGVIVGRVLFSSGFTSMTYYKALSEILGDIPIIMDADIGHVAPKMSIINGSICNIKYENNKGVIKQYLK